MKILTIILLCLAAVCSFHSSSEMHDPTGIRYIDRGNISFTHSIWKINYSLSLDDFMAQSEQLKKCKHKIIELCDKLNSENNCNYFIRFIKTNERILEYDFEKIQLKTKRSKRFLTIIALVYVWIKNWITNDNINQEIIDYLQSIDQENRDIVKDHITISNDTLNIHKRAFHKIIHAINHLHEDIRRLEKAKTSDALKINLSNTIQTATIIFLNHYQLMSTLTKILMNDKNANLLEIIDESIFKTNLLNIVKKLGENQALPANISNPLSILQITDVAIHVAGTDISIEIKIPIVNEDPYEYYQIIGIPYRHNDKMLLIDSLSQNIIVNRGKNEYTLISDSDLGKCKIINERLKLCQLRTFFFTDLSCEFDAFANNNTQNCKKREIPPKSYIMRLTPNSFMIIPFVKTQVMVSCADNSTTIYTVETNFQVEVQSGCSIQNEDFRYEINSEFSENITIALANQTFNNLNFNETIYLPENNNNNNTLSIEEFDSEFRNATAKLIELYLSASKTPARIIVSNNEIGLIMIIIIAIAVLLLVRLGCNLLGLQRS